MKALPQNLLTRPIAHRALHDVKLGRVENSLSALEAAIAEGYAIEIDVQLSRDQEAIVFHDYELSRLTEKTGLVRDFTAAELGAIPLKGGGDTIPTLSEILDYVGGRVPLLIEIKDQDGRLGPHIGALETRVAELVGAYRGECALMSFNPHAAVKLKALLPEYAVGLVTDPYYAQDWPNLSDDERNYTRKMPHLEALDFISHNVDDLSSPFVAKAKAKSYPILCWTVKSPEKEATARKIADNITFETYLPK